MLKNPKHYSIPLE